MSKLGKGRHVCVCTSNCTLSSYCGSELPWMAWRLLVGIALVYILNTVSDYCPATGPANLEPLYDPPSKEDLTQLLYMVTDWYSVGLKLGLTTDELDEIRYGGGPREQKKQLARVWLEAMRVRGEQPTWQKLRTVLAELKMVRAVENIDKKYSEWLFFFTIYMIWSHEHVSFNKEGSLAAWISREESHLQYHTISALPSTLIALRTVPLQPKPSQFPNRNFHAPVGTRSQLAPAQLGL